MLRLKVSISARLYDKHGKLVRKYRPRPAHSFLAHFIELLYVQMSQTPANITNTHGNEVSQAPVSQAFRVTGYPTEPDLGILIGSGTDPVAIDDYKLQTIITSDLTVQAHTFALSYPTPGSRRLAISRTFTNALSSPMAIEEVALYTTYYPGFPICTDRTLYSVSIPASSSLQLTYRIDVSV